MRRPPSWQSVRSAELLAELLHAGQRDLQGEDYFQAHVLEVVKALGAQPAYRALSLEAKGVAVQVALLHDALEDAFHDVAQGTQVLVALRVPDVVTRAVRVLSKSKRETRTEYLGRVLGAPPDIAPIVRAVKQADNAVNLRRSLALPDDHPDRARLVEKYSGEREVLAAEREPA